MSRSPAFSARYEAALTLAAQAHLGQFRKGVQIPYIVHPVHVAAILERYKFPEDVVIAGLLHDTVEDSGLSLETIGDNFGKQVADIISALTEKKQDNHGEIAWEKRRAAALEQLIAAGTEVAAVKAADILHNAATITIELYQYGPKIWDGFHRGPGPIMQNYQSVLQVVQQKLGHHHLVAELEETLEELETAIAKNGSPFVKR